MPEVGQNGRAIDAAESQMRLVQIDFFDEPVELRRQRLGEELTSILNSVIPQERPTFLRALEQRFPVPEETGPAPLAPPAPVGIDEAQLKDPGFLIEKLKALAPSLSAEKKLAIAGELAGVGIAPPKPPAPPAQKAPPAAAPAPPPPAPVAQAASGPYTLPPEIEELLKKKLEFSSKQPLDGRRAAELLATVLPEICDVDTVVWRVWKDVSGGKSSINQQAILNKLLAKCLDGDPAFASPRIAEGVDKTKLMAIGFPASIMAAGNAARAAVKKLDPENIESAMGGGFGAEKKWWKQYRAQFTEVHESIVPEINEAITRFVEQLFKNRRSS